METGHHHTDQESERAKEEARPPVWDAGLQQISQWLLELNPKSGETTHLLTQPELVTSRGRNERQELTLSLIDLAANSQIFEWWQIAPDEFKEAVTKHPEIAEKLLILNELTAMYTAAEDELTQARLVPAVIQALAELELLGEIHLEQYVSAATQRKIDLKRQPLYRRLPAQLGDSLWYSMVRFGKDARRELGELRLLAEDKLNVGAAPAHQHGAGRTNPLAIGNETSAGSERLDPPSREVVMEATLAGVSPDHDVMIVTKIFNQYDPKASKLANTLHAEPKPPLNPEFDYEAGPYFTIPIPAGSLQAHQTIALPRPIEIKKNARITDLDDSQAFELWSAKIQPEPNTERVPANSEPLLMNRWIYIDAAGNLTLRVTPDLADHLYRTNAELVVQYCARKREHGIRAVEAYRYMNIPTQPSAPGAAATDPRYYPAIFYRLLEQLTEKHRSIEEFFSDETKKEIDEGKRLMFIDRVINRVVGFLGQSWLSYSHYDAPIDRNDPPGLTQPERVLRSRKASCEGSNLAAGELLRPLLKDGQQLLYVEGYKLDQVPDAINVSVPVRANQNHLALMVIDKENAYVSYADATPLAPDIHEARNAYLAERQRIMKDWQQTEKQVLELCGKEGIPALTNDHESWRRRLSLVLAMEAEWISQRDFLGTNYDRFKSESETGVDVKALVPPPDFTNLIFNNNTTLAAVAGWQLIGNFTTTENAIQLMGWLRPTSPLVYEPYFTVHLPRFEDAVSWRDGARLNTHVFSYKQPAVDYATDPKQWARLKNRLVHITSYAQEASLQNQALLAEIINYVTEFQPKQQAETRFKAMLGRALGDRLPQDLDDFWQQAPFLLLLDGPIQALSSILGYSLNGHLLMLPLSVTDTPEDRRAIVVDRLNRWQEVQDQLLAKYEQLLKEAPVDLAQTVHTVRWGAMQFIPQSESVGLAGAEEGKVLVDPIKVYQFLLAKQEEAGQPINPEVYIKDSSTSAPEAPKSDDADDHVW